MKRQLSHSSLASVARSAKGSLSVVCLALALSAPAFGQQSSNQNQPSNQSGQHQGGQGADQNRDHHGSPNQNGRPQSQPQNQNGRSGSWNFSRRDGQTSSNRYGPNQNGRPQSQPQNQNGRSGSWNFSRRDGQTGSSGASRGDWRTSDSSHGGTQASSGWQSYRFQGYADRAQSSQGGQTRDSYRARDTYSRSNSNGPSEPQQDSFRRGNSSGQDRSDSLAQGQNRGGSRDSNQGQGGRDHGGDHNLGRTGFRAPSVADTRRGPDLGYLVNRSASVGVADYRRGYYHYNAGFHDHDFAFRNYVYDPYRYHAYLSPFYDYPCLPGYVAYDGISIVAGLPGVFIGVNYVWHPYHHLYGYSSYNSGYQAGYEAGVRDGDRNPQLDRAIDTIVNAFQHKDFHAVDLMIGRGSKINIYEEGKYAYSMEADNFYDLMRDTIQNVDTVAYEVINVRRNRDEGFIVTRHTFNNPDGSRDAIYQSFRLHLGGTPTIFEFGTSKSEPRF
jgi:hypothetical protein